ncbi:ubiE/COQ5 methyltransferase [Lepidopterella palustris CBS 459.81]|uniref:Arsenite methyltransferase n=1 Tax=Lepidopterella palustris CBS 459.81 TaxID=1314670 RepID=A0A8E2E6K8_9PEZI|nr:ubiE/COQ5 methyltransferase [Lepidopterella palustris CBS 459.81]
MNSEQIYQQVQDHYGSAARSTSTEYGRSVAKSFGYSEAELANIPKEANLGLSCGNPIAIASLREGETVIDLGSGAGFDVFLAATKVGPSGRVIGVDMNKEMLARANENKERAGAKNVEFAESQITNIALDSGIADCVISNCVVNLVPEAEKHLAFEEMFRLLKSGGRIAMSDILAKKPLPDEIRENVGLYVGCIAGASQVGDYEKYLRQAGFSDVIIVDTNSDLNVYMEIDEDGIRKEQACCSHKTAGCCEPVKQATCCLDKPANCCSGGKDKTKATGTLQGLNLNEWAGSYKIFAVKH